jgi:hypothetical protein
MRFVCVRAMLVTGVPAVAAAVFLFLGFGVGAFAGRPYVGQGLITAGLVAGAVAAGTAVGDLAWFLMAARGRSDPDEAAAGGGDTEVRAQPDT